MIDVIFIDSLPIGPMAAIRLISRRITLSGLGLTSSSATRSPSAALWSSTSLSAAGVRGQRAEQAFNGRYLSLRPMSYMSNVRRFPGRYRQTFRLVLFGVTVGSAYLLFEIIYGFVSKKYRSKLLLPSAAKLLTAEELPQITPTRSVSGPTNLGLSLTLFQYQSCPFCCKVRAFLDYYGIPYDVVEVNPVLRQQLKFSKYRKVPILLIRDNGEEEVLQINDSTTIVSALSSYLISRKPESKHKDESLFSIADWYKTEKVIREDGLTTDEIVNKYFLMFGDIEKQKLNLIETSVAEERNWRRWADDHLVHTLSPNIYRTIDESYRSFQHFSVIGDWDHNFKPWEKYLCVYLGSTAMYLIGKRLKKKHHLNEEVRESLYNDCRRWLKAVGKDRKFMGGERPNLADLVSDWHFINASYLWISC